MWPIFWRIVAIPQPVLHRPQTNTYGQVKCRVCGCTDRHTCNPPCHWAEEDLCSTCLEAARALLNWGESAVKPDRNALWMELNRLYRRILREQKKSAAADVRQTDWLAGEGSPMNR
jgi:hypothetical protein